MDNPLGGFMEWYQGLPQYAQIGIPVAGAAGVFLIVKSKGGAGSLVSGPFGSSTGGGTAGGPLPNPAGSPPPNPAPIGGGGGSGAGGGGATGTSPTSTPSSGTSPKTSPTAQATKTYAPPAKSSLPVTVLPGTRYQVPSSVAVLANQYNAAMQANQYAAKNPSSLEAKTIQHQRQADVIGVYRQQAFLAQYNTYASQNPASLSAKIIEHQRQGDVFAFNPMVPGTQIGPSLKAVKAHQQQADVSGTQQVRAFVQQYNKGAPVNSLSASIIEHQRQGDVYGVGSPAQGNIKANAKPAAPAMAAAPQSQARAEVARQAAQVSATQYHASVQPVGHPYIQPAQLVHRAAAAKAHQQQYDVKRNSAPESQRRAAQARNVMAAVRTTYRQPAKVYNKPVARNRAVAE